MGFTLEAGRWKSGGVQVPFVMETTVKAVRNSGFKQPEAGAEWFRNWADKLAKLNGKNGYEGDWVHTSLGKTWVWHIAGPPVGGKPVVIFPGFRTTPLFWDFDGHLAEISKNRAVYLVETNGQPNISDGASPDINGNGYGLWAGEVLNGLGLEKCWVAGASFGALVALKLCIVYPEKVLGTLLLAPGCLQTFSMSFKNLYYNLLPILSPKDKNIRIFLNKAVLHPPSHQISELAFNLLLEYQSYVLKNYKDKTQKPYAMGPEMEKVQTKVWVMLGDRDPLFPMPKSAANARKHLSNLQEIYTMKGVAHGLEVHGPALKLAEKIMATH